MSTTEQDTAAADPADSSANATSSSAAKPEADASDSAAAEGAASKPTSKSMREGAMARVAPRRDLAARRQGAARSMGAAGGSAAAASAGRAPGASRPPAGGRSTAAPRRTGPRRVRLTVQRIDPWSVFKISFLLSVALGISMVIMVAVLWTVLSGMNVFATVNEFIVQVTSGEDSATTFDLMQYIGLGRVVSLSAVFAVANVVLLTALATLSAFLYNVCAALVGGTHLTLSDE